MSVSGMFQKCFKSVSRVFKECFKIVSSVIQDVSSESQKGFTCISRLCFKIYLLILIT